MESVEQDAEAREAKEKLIRDAFAFAEQNPGKWAVVFTKDFQHTKHNIRQAAELHPEYPVSMIHQRIELPNKARVLFAHCADHQDLPRYNGYEFHWLGIDADNPPDTEIIRSLLWRIPGNRINRMDAFIRQALTPYGRTTGQ